MSGGFYLPPQNPASGYTSPISPYARFAPPPFSQFQQPYYQQPIYQQPMFRPFSQPMNFFGGSFQQPMQQLINPNLAGQNSDIEPIPTMQQQPLSPPIEPPTEPYPIDDAYFPPKSMAAYAAEDRAVAAGQDIQDLLMNIQNTQNRMNAAGPLQSGFYQPE